MTNRQEDRRLGFLQKIFNSIGGEGYSKPNWRQKQGTAQWTKDSSDLSEMLQPDRCGWPAVPLGVNSQRGTKGPFWNAKRQQGHGLCFAPNRSGKGASVIIPALLKYAGSMVVMDPKGENAWITAQHRRNMGQRVVILDPWNEVSHFAGIQNAEKLTKFNPLSFITRLKPDGTPNSNFIDDVTAIAEALIVTPQTSSDPHWPDSARDYVAGVTALIKEAYGPRATLANLRKLLLVHAELVSLAEKVRLKLPNSFALRRLDSFLDPSKEMLSIMSTARTQTSFLDSPDLLDAMQNDRVPFSMDDLISQRTTLYVVIPPDKLESHGRWLRMIITLVLRAITRATEQPDVPTMLLLDEMGSIGPLKSLDSAYRLLAGYNVRFFGFYQSLVPLKNDYPHTWGNFIENCSVLQVLAASGETAEYFSNRLGNTTITETQFGHGPVQRTQHSRPLMYPHEMAALLGSNEDRIWDNTQLVMFKNGAENILTLQNPYFYHPGYRGLYRPPPKFAGRNMS